MNARIQTQIAALALAAVTTLAILGSVSGVADHQYDRAVAAATQASTQHVVIVAKRLQAG